PRENRKSASSRSPQGSELRTAHRTESCIEIQGREHAACRNESESRSHRVQKSRAVHRNASRFEEPRYPLRSTEGENDGLKSDVARPGHSCVEAEYAGKRRRQRSGK